MLSRQLSGEEDAFQTVVGCRNIVRRREEVAALVTEVVAERFEAPGGLLLPLHRRLLYCCSPTHFLAYEPSGTLGFRKVS